MTWFERMWQRYHTPKKTYRWQISIWKNTQHHTSGTCKLKQWDVTTHLLQKLKSTTLKADKFVYEQELSLIAGGNIKCTDTLQDKLAVSLPN